MDSYPGPSTSTIQFIQRQCRIESLDWRHGAHSAADSLLSEMVNDDELVLEVVNLLLAYVSRTYDAYETSQELQFMLHTAGSAWTVARREDEPFHLERRVPEELADRFAAVSAKGRAGEHLRSAWSEMYGRDPTPSTAYREAVRAVEAAGATVISPDNDRTTLGTMIRDFAAKPEKWEVPLGKDADEGREVLLMMMRGVWHGQSDRHGTPDETAPLSVSPPEAEAALHTAITLVHLFTSGLVTRNAT